MIGEHWKKLDPDDSSTWPEPGQLIDFRDDNGDLLWPIQVDRFWREGSGPLCVEGPYDTFIGVTHYWIVTPPPPDGEGPNRQVILDVDSKNSG